MNCHEFVEFLSDYLEGELPGAAKNEFEAHLRVCEDCERYLAGFASTVGLARDAFSNPDGPVPDDVPEELIRAFAAARRRD